ncbi:MAG: hypothetical protein AB7S49_11890 [Arcobacter sp.]
MTFKKNIKRSALLYLENGGIVCFDDFERKSKKVLQKIQKSLIEKLEYK